MRTETKVSFVAGLGRVLALGLLVWSLGPASAWAQSSEPPELVPGMDLWTHEREAAPYWQSESAGAEVESRAKRHREFMEGGVPVEYRSHSSPYPAATKVIEAGGELYVAHCAECHGARGLGDGKAGLDLTPSPALLAYLIERPRAVDEYLLWSISEGGAQFGTAMPAFKDRLSEDQIWQIVTYMRAGFPVVASTGQ